MTIVLDVCQREACVTCHKKQSRINKCMNKCSCLKSLCDGYDVESDKYREFNREGKICLQDDKPYRKKRIICMEKRSVKSEQKIIPI